MTVSTMIIVVHDNLVLINGIGHKVDCSGLAGIHAVHWNGSIGEIEYEFVNGSKLPPTKNLTDISMFQSEIDAWKIADDESSALLTGRGDKGAA